MNESRESLNHWALMILATIAVTTALIYTRPVVMPLVIAVFCFFVVAPVVIWLCTKLRLPRWAAFLVTLLGFLSLSSLLVLLIGSSLESFWLGANEYRESLLVFVQKTLGFLDRYGLHVERETLKHKLAALPFFSLAKNFTGGMLSFLGKFLLVVVFLLFLLLGHQGRSPQTPLLAEVQAKISRYVATKFFISVITGILIMLIFGVMGVDLAAMFGVLAFLLNFIPSVGSIVATLLPLPVVLLQFGMGGTLLLALLLPGAVQILIGNILEPKLMGEGMDLHPVTILFFLLFWGLVWGVAGMFLAVPITAIAKIVLSRIDSTKPLAELLAGRFLSP